jgi:hypothetical protein
MWLLTLIMEHWKLGLIALVTASLVAYGQAMKYQRDSAREDLHQLQQDVQAERVANQLAIDVVRADSERTLEVINRDHKTILEQTKKNALAAYIAKYGRGNVACGIRADRLPNMPRADTAQAGTTDSAESPTEAQPTSVPLDLDFLDRASEAAVMIKECQQFVTFNRFPVEK